MATNTFTEPLPTPVMARSDGLTGAEFDQMVERGAFETLGSKKVELLRGQISIMNPAGPVHDDFIQELTTWSIRAGAPDHHVLRVQCGIVCDDDRPEPDIAWLQPKRYGRQRPAAADIQLLIEVAEKSLAKDLRLKTKLYAEAGVAEYWIADIPGRQIHVFHQPTNGSYQFEETVHPPRLLAPQVRPHSPLDTGDLFSILQSEGSTES